MAAKKKTTKARKGPGRARPFVRAAKSAKAPRIRDYMTRSVRTIGSGESLARAHELMNRHRIRHLPVLDGGRLVGIVSQRDLYLVESLLGDKPETVTVEEAMTRDVFEAPATAPLAGVARTMLRKKYGCAVITEAGKVVGVFSTVDALEALLSRL